MSKAVNQASPPSQTQALSARNPPIALVIVLVVVLVAVLVVLLFLFLLWLMWSLLLLALPHE
jgi:hypothetical protein